MFCIFLLEIFAKSKKKSSKFHFLCFLKIICPARQNLKRIFYFKFTRGWSRPTSKKAPAVSSRLRVEGDQGQEPQAFNTTPNSTAIMHIPYTRLNTLKYHSRWINLKIKIIKYTYKILALVKERKHKKNNTTTNA
jgi:hypothetical protein